MMQQHNPVHPGIFIKKVYLEPLAVSANQLSKDMGVHSSTIIRLINAKSAISPEMALRLEKVLGRSAQSWMLMQDHYDLFHTRKTVDVSKLNSLPVLAAG